MSAKRRGAALVVTANTCGALALDVVRRLAAKHRRSPPSGPEASESTE